MSEPAFKASSGAVAEVTIGQGAPGELRTEGFVGAGGADFILGVGGYYSRTGGSDDDVSELAIGPGLRWSGGRSDSGRAEVIGALDLRYAASTNGDATDKGLTLAFGPGLRAWLNEHIAVGLLMRLQTTPIAFRSLDNSDTPRDAVGSFSVSGALQLLAVF